MWLLFHATHTRTGSHSGLIKLPPKNTKGEPSNGRLAFLRIVSCAERIRVGEVDNPKAVGSTPKKLEIPACSA